MSSQQQPKNGTEPQLRLVPAMSLTGKGLILVVMANQNMPFRPENARALADALVKHADAIEVGETAFMRASLSGDELPAAQAAGLRAAQVELGGQ